MTSIRPRSLRLLRLLLLPMLISIASTACSNAPPAPLAVVTADPLPQPTRPTPEAPPPVKLNRVTWRVVLDPLTKEPLFALTVQGLYALEGNHTMLGGWMADAKSVIDLYRADNAAANAANTAPAVK